MTRLHAAMLALSAAATLAAPALAQTVSDGGSDQTVRTNRTYIAGTVGYAMPNDLQSDAGVRAGLTSGAAYTVALGRSFGPLRAEIEGGYRRSRVESASGFGLFVPGTGRVSAWSAMANVYLDPKFSIGIIQPYIGGGVGVADFRARNVSATGLPAGLPVTDIGAVSGSKTGFAYQGMAGLGIGLGQNAALTIGYRYFATPGADIDMSTGGKVNIRGLKVHSVDAGVRFAF
jgi:opacity protein-like surface antigen